MSKPARRSHDDIEIFLLRHAADIEHGQLAFTQAAGPPEIFIASRRAERVDIEPAREDAQLFGGDAARGPTLAIVLGVHP